MGKSINSKEISLFPIYAEFSGRSVCPSFGDTHYKYHIISSQISSNHEFCGFLAGFPTFSPENFPPAPVLPLGPGAGSVASSPGTWAVGSPWTVQASPEANVLICVALHEGKHLMFVWMFLRLSWIIMDYILFGPSGLHERTNLRGISSCGGSPGIGGILGPGFHIDPCRSNVLGWMPKTYHLWVTWSYMPTTESLISIAFVVYFYLERSQTSSPSSVDNNPFTIIHPISRALQIPNMAPNHQIFSYPQLQSGLGAGYFLGVTHILHVALHAAELACHVDQRTELCVVVRVAAAGAMLRALLEGLWTWRLPRSMYENQVGKPWFSVRTMIYTWWVFHIHVGLQRVNSGELKPLFGSPWSLCEGNS